MSRKSGLAVGNSGGSIGEYPSPLGRHVMLRLAFGDCSCTELHARHPVVRAICEALLQRLAVLEDHAKHKKHSIPAEWVERQSIDSHEVEFAVLRHDLGSEGTLVVVRAFAPTWRFPNYVGLGGIGQVRANGFILAPDGSTRPAPPESLWEYR